MLKNIFPLQIYEVDFPNYDLIKDNLLSDIMTLFNKNLELYSKHRLILFTNTLEHRFLFLFGYRIKLYKNRAI